MADIDLFPMNHRPPRRWFAYFPVAVTVLLALGVAATPGIVPRAEFSLLALGFGAAFWVNGRWDVLGVRWRPWWAAILALVVAGGWLQGGSIGDFDSWDAIVCVAGLFLGGRVVFARRRVPGTVLGIGSPFGAGFGGYVLQGGASAALNRHHGHPEQRWALDIVPIGGRYGRNMAGRVAVPVVAPVAGVVVDAVDEWADSGAAGRVGPAYGNNVVLECECECEAGVTRLYLCHLAEGSVAVRTGDVVAAGQLLGMVGNSGRSTEPHLHIHASGSRAVPLAVLGRQVWRSRSVHLKVQ